MFNASFFRNLPPVTKNLLIINILIWAFINILPSAGMKLIDIGALHYIDSPGFGVWQLFTYMFIQEGFTHLFFNMWALLMFGFIIEFSLGSRRFLFYYISCGIGAAIVQLIVYGIMISRYSSMMTPEQYRYIVDSGWTIMHNGGSFPLPYSIDLQTAHNLISLVNTPTIGASGAVFGILLAFGMLFPDRPMYIMFIPVPVKAKWLVLGYGLLELGLGFGAQGDGVAHFAHLGGMIFGFIMIYYWWKKGLFNGWHQY